MTDRIASFDEFWPFYVREHSKPLTRWMHFAGTSAAMACGTALVKSRKLRWIPIGLVAGYGPAWISHFFVEKNRPASFKYPLWSLIADLKMWDLMRRGLMDAEVERVLGHAAGSNGASHGAAAREGQPSRAAAN